MSPRLRRRSTEPAEQLDAGTATATTTEPPPTEATPEPAPESAQKPTPEPTPTPAPTPASSPASRGRERRRTLAHATPILLLRAAHPRLAALTAAGVAVAAALSGRPGREVGLVLATVLVGQAVLGWHNDLVDRRRDAQHLPSGKPIADGYLDPGTAWFALGCGVLLLVPLAISNGVTAGCLYLASVGIGLLGNLILRSGWLSWLTWAASYALLPGFLSYGGWGGQATGNPPATAMVALAAALGVGVHFLCALPGLVGDHENGFRHLPLRVALKIGATRLLIASLAWTGLALVGLLLVGNAVGLSQ
ncbi:MULTISPECIES: UbiA family prenyltransferase [unclassified Nocardioides]|uniref:UbiA family prenyltransferase n=1 Tax=unclassified Nocardioides TaxID=2615069 RepID=UPI0009E92115|nr:MULTISPECIES: UbiA family prenyltransferase [unclassified Nocardioides]